MTTATVTVKTGSQLASFCAKPDVFHSVTKYSSGYKYKTGTIWSIWVNDDPRFENGINVIARYKCVEGGNEQTSLWEKIV